MARCVVAYPFVYESTAIVNEESFFSWLDCREYNLAVSRVKGSADRKSSELKLRETVRQGIRKVEFERSFRFRNRCSKVSRKAIQPNCIRLKCSFEGNLLGFFPFGVALSPPFVPIAIGTTAGKCYEKYPIWYGGRHPSSRGRFPGLHPPQRRVDA